MKRGLKQKSCIFLVMALVFFTGKAALAESHSPFKQCDTKVEGTICSINTDNRSITLCDDNDYSPGEEVSVYGIPFFYLLKEHELDLEAVLGALEDPDKVTFSVHECPMSEGAKLKACVITIIIYNGETTEITVFPPSERGVDPVSADVNGNQGKSGQGRF